VTAIVVAYLLTRRERFTETSYYYGAAPGSRGERMICMPENANLGLALGRAAGCAAARVAKNACGPLVDRATVKKITKNTKTMASKAANAAVMQVVAANRQKMTTVPGTGEMPAMCRPYLSRFYAAAGDVVATAPQCPSGYAWNGAQCVKTSPGCAPGHIWDGKQCRLPKAAGGGVKTSPGCAPGKIWDGKKCRLPKAAGGSVAKTSPGCAPGKIWDGKKCRLPKAAGGVKTSPGCAPGKVWDGKKCRAPKKSKKPKKSGGKKKTTSPGCGAGKVWDGKKCRAPKTKK
jgi:hypothetical protein